LHLNVPGTRAACSRDDQNSHAGIGAPDQETPGGAAANRGSVSSKQRFDMAKTSTASNKAPPGRPTTNHRRSV
jgi:hypothetical protein